MGCGEREMGDEGGHNAGEEERGEVTGVLPVGRLVASFERSYDKSNPV